MNRKRILLLVLWALLAILTFNPYGAWLGTLSYKYVPDSKAVSGKPPFKGLLSADEGRNYFPRNSVGVMPVSFLKRRVKWCGYSKPRRCAVSLIL